MLCLNGLQKVIVRGPFTEERLCALTLQFTLCMASSVRRDAGGMTPLRTGHPGASDPSLRLRLRSG